MRDAWRDNTGRCNRACERFRRRPGRATRSEEESELPPRVSVLKNADECMFSEAMHRLNLLCNLNHMTGLRIVVTPSTCGQHRTFSTRDRKPHGALDFN